AVQVPELPRHAGERTGPGLPGPAVPSTAPMNLEFSPASRGDTRVVRTAAIAVIVGLVIVALYFGRDVLLPAAMAVLFSFVLGPVVTGVRRLLPMPLAVALVVIGALILAGLLTALILTQLAEV